MPMLLSLVWLVRNISQGQGGHLPTSLKMVWQSCHRCWEIFKEEEGIWNPIAACEWKRQEWDQHQTGGKTKGGNAKVVDNMGTVFWLDIKYLSLQSTRYLAFYSNVYTLGWRVGGRIEGLGFCANASALVPRPPHEVVRCGGCGLGIGCMVSLAARA